MVGIDCYVFGYRKIKIPPDKLSEATSVLLRGSIPSRINSDGTFMIRERDFNKMSALFNGRIEFLHSKPLGLYGKYKMLKHKAIYISAIIITIAYYFLFKGENVLKNIKLTIIDDIAKYKIYLF